MLIKGRTGVIGLKLGSVYWLTNCFETQQIESSNFQKKFIKLFFADIRSVLPCYHLFKSVLKTVWFARFSHCNKMTALYNFENIQESYATVRLIGNELLWLTSKSKLFDVR